MKNFFLCLVSLALLNLALAAVFQHEVHQGESLKMKLIREGRWGEYYALKQSRLHGKFSNFKSTSQNIGDYSDLKYYVNVTVGTPEQFFSLFLYIGDGNILIPDIACGDCETPRRFNSSKSSTYQKTDYPLYSYPDYGHYAQDFVRIGNPGTDQLTIPKAMFGQVFMYLGNSIADGIMGLGFTTDSSNGVDPPMVTAIKSGILDNPLVTLFLRSCGADTTSNKGGVITYGALDTVNCDRNVVYESLPDPNSLQFIVKNTALGSSQFSGNWNASIDVTVDSLYVPRPVAEAFFEQVNAAYDYQNNVYTIDCNAKFNLNLTIGDTVYTLTEKQMVLDFKNGMCVFPMFGIAYDRWYLGTPWLRTFCNVLDYGNKRVGFAKVITS